MNPARLLTHFHRLADAPDAVPLLRHFILDLAVRGKLVEQDSKDEPASALLTRNDTEKARLIKAGELRRIDTFERVAAEELPFSPPRGWEVARMGSLASKLGAGSTPLGGKRFYQTEGVPFLRSQNVHDDGLRLDDVAFIPRTTHDKMSGTHIRKNDVLLNITGASIGRCALVPDSFTEGNVSQHVAIIRLILPEIREFIHLSLVSPLYQQVIADAEVGVSREGLSMQRLRVFPMLIPPVAEQRRIVAKVEELMSLCDRLEAAQAEREKRRDRLASASVQRVNQLTSADPQTFREHARFHLRHLPRLTVRPDQIPALRQTILNFAVRGRLAPCDAWPKQPDPLREFAVLQNGYAFKSEWFVRSGVRLLRNANVSHGVMRWEDVTCLPVDRACEFERFQLNEGDIVLSLDRPFIVTGTKVARVRAADLPSLLLQRVGRFQTKRERLISDYLFLWLHSPHFTDQIDPGRSNGVPHISSKQVEGAAIYVPTVAEQKRIVAKVEEMMALCDWLEAQLTTTQTESRRLLEAVLREALAA